MWCWKSGNQTQVGLYSNHSPISHFYFILFIVFLCQRALNPPYKEEGWKTAHGAGCTGQVWVFVRHCPPPPSIIVYNSGVPWHGMIPPPNIPTQAPVSSCQSHCPKIISEVWGWGSLSTTWQPPNFPKIFQGLCCGVTFPNNDFEKYFLVIKTW